MNNEPHPLRNFSQAMQLAIAQIKLGYLKEDLAAFQAWNGQRFDDAYLADFEAAIQLARDYVDDETVVDQGTIYTRKLDELMEACRGAYKKLRYYVSDVFKNDPGIQNQFGFNDYAKARTSRSRMIVFMGKLHRLAEAHKPPLLAEGYAQADIDRLLQLRDQLEAATIQRGTFKGRRRDLTAQRREHFQYMGQYVWQTCQAGSMIFPLGNSRHARYIIPRKRGSKVPAEGMWLEAKTKTVALNGGLAPEQRLQLANLGQVPLRVYGGKTENEQAPDRPFLLAPGEAAQLTAGELNGGQGFHSLIVWNANDRPARYLARVMD